MRRLFLATQFAVSILLPLVLLTAPAEARFLSIQASPGVGGKDQVQRFVLGGAATIWILPDDFPVKLGIRPQLDWHQLDGANEFTVTGNAELGLSLSDTVLLSIYGGGGMTKVSGGTDLDALLAAGVISEGGLLFLLGKGVIEPGSASVLTAGVDLKVFLGDHFYLVPGFGFAKVSGDMEANNYQATVGIGVAF